MEKLAIMFSIDHFSRRDVVREFSGRDRGDIRAVAEGIASDKDDYDPDEHIRVLTLEELACRFNDQMLDDQEWWLVFANEIGDPGTCSFQEIKGEAYDISGVKDPDGWLYKKHGGIWYPCEQK